MFTKDELIEKGTHYFEKNKITSMLATTDGNFFYESNRSFAESHAKTNKIEVIVITNVEVAAHVKAKEEEKTPAKKEKKVTEKKTEKGKSDSAETTPAKSKEKDSSSEGEKEETKKDDKKTVNVN